MLQDALAAKSAKAKSPIAQQVASCGRWFNGKGYFLGVEYTRADLAWAVWFKGVQSLGLRLPDNAALYCAKLATRPVLAAYFKAA